MKGERVLRLMALLVLCGLVYYFSYDHGRSSMRGTVTRLEAENGSLKMQLALQAKEIDDLRKSRVQPQGEERQRLTLKLSENKLLFNDRLVLTLVEVNSHDSEALVRVHYLEADNRETTLMKPGDSLSLSLDNFERRLFLDQLKGSQAFFILFGLN